MELLEATQEEGREVLVETVVGRTVVLLRNGDVGRPVEEPVDGDPALGSRQRRSGTPVDAVPEGDVLSTGRAVDVELVGMVEYPRVPIAGAGDQHQLCAGRDVDIPELGGVAGHPELGAQGA